MPAFFLIIVFSGFVMPVSVIAQDTNSISPQQQTLGEKAIENAEKLLGLGYGFGGKGFDYNSKKLASAEDIKKGYQWYNAETGELEISSKIDCSGLVSWAFNAAAGAEKLEYPLDKKNTNSASLWTKDHNADYSIGNSGFIHSSPPDASDLDVGDLLFLDTPRVGAGQIDHVAMYAGINPLTGKGEVIQSTPENGVERISYDQWLNTNYSGTTTYRAYFAGYGRLSIADKLVNVPEYVSSIGSAENTKSIKKVESVDNPNTKERTLATTDVSHIGSMRSDIKWQETDQTDTLESEIKRTIQTEADSSTEKDAIIETLYPITNLPLDDSNTEETKSDKRISLSPVVADVAAFGAPDSIDGFGETSSIDTTKSDTKGTTQITDESNSEKSTVIPTLYPIKSLPPDESNTEESTRIQTIYPVTSPPPDESNTYESARIPVLYPITSLPPDESNTEESSTTSRLTESKFGDTTLSAAQPVDSKPDIAFGDTKESSTTGQITKSKFGEIPFGGNQRQVTSHSKISFGDQADVPASQERSDVVLIDSDYGAKFFSERSDRSAEKHENGLKEAVALSLQGKYDDAVQVYKTAIGFEAEDTTYARFYFEIGDTLIQQGRNDEAIQMYKKVLTLDPDSYAIGIYDPSSAWARIGDALNGLGRTTEAKAAFVVADELKQEYENLQNYSNPQKSGQGDWLQFGSGRSSWEEEDKMIRSTGGYSRPAPGQGSPGSSGGLTPEQRQAIEQAIDNMEPVGEYNQYYNTNPRYELAGDPSWAN